MQRRFPYPLALLASLLSISLTQAQVPQPAAPVGRIPGSFSRNMVRG